MANESKLKITYQHQSIVNDKENNDSQRELDKVIKYVWEQLAPDILQEIQNELTYS
ncbi:hypothetical protein [Paenibacillus endoradicis]|uniref:hypothetical protein n=1 Tax=Paenibacillus endoradicis TaxID=2972487 RepID=UPI0021598C0B|nr:hypothetical protein [Paenibacillus endoradicis]MCR8655846.1 hypothetical protein [Paenibacillus endoradicis]MCR8658172.1 hypothetical protein [Paenibacillus endoradicis]